MTIRKITSSLALLRLPLCKLFLHCGLFLHCTPVAPTYRASTCSGVFPIVSQDFINSFIEKPPSSSNLVVVYIFSDTSRECPYSTCRTDSPVPDALSWMSSVKRFPLLRTRLKQSLFPVTRTWKVKNTKLVVVRT